MNVLLAGGAGYIGSHTSLELLDAGKEIVILDNFYNSCPKVLERLEELSGKKILRLDAENVPRARDLAIAQYVNIGITEFS